MRHVFASMPIGLTSGSATLYIVRADLPPPMPRPVPRTILFQRKRANRRILNEHMFLNVLREFGEVTSSKP